MSRSLQFNVIGNLTHLHGENHEDSPYIFLYWPLQQLKVRLMGHQGPWCPNDEVWMTQRLPEDVELTALVISLWVSLYLVFLLLKPCFIYITTWEFHLSLKSKGVGPVWTTANLQLQNQKGRTKTPDSSSVVNFMILRWSQDHEAILGAPCWRKPLDSTGEMRFDAPWRHWGGRTKNQPQRMGTSAWAARLKNTLRRAHPQDFWI